MIRQIEERSFDAILNQLLPFEGVARRCIPEIYIFGASLLVGGPPNEEDPSAGRGREFNRSRERLASLGRHRP